MSSRFLKFFLIIILGYMEISILSATNCLRFTWRGPKFDNESRFLNVTACNEIDPAYTGPCMEPLVVTSNSSYPDLTYLWDNYKDVVSCHKTKGEVCGTWTYHINGEITNQTFMCTKMIIDDEGGTIENGCVEQNTGGYVVRACGCNYGLDDNLPCNAYLDSPSFSSSISSSSSSSLVIISCFIFYIFNGQFKYKH